MIAFTGARVIEQTIREKVADGARRVEYLKDRGMVDMIVHRYDLRPMIARLCRLLTKAGARKVAQQRRKSHSDSNSLPSDSDFPSKS
jgi:acetyl-CoA carboxylase carboxyl transferase subunit beta